MEGSKASEGRLCWGRRTRPVLSGCGKQPSPDDGQGHSKEEVFSHAEASWSSQDRETMPLPLNLIREGGEGVTSKFSTLPMPHLSQGLGLPTTKYQRLGT